MFLLGDAPFRWSDPSSWPWFVYVWLAFFLAGWLKPAWVWLRREQTKSWPTTTARIDSTYIAEPKRFLGLTLQANRSGGQEAVLAYSYVLSGGSFRGEYKRSFGSELEAEEFLRDLDGRPIAIQYDPNKMSRSAVLDEAIESVLRSRPPKPESAGDRGFWLDSLPRPLRFLLDVFSLLALAGLALSIWVHVGALFGRQVAPDFFFWGLHIGIFVVFLPAVLVAQKRVGRTSGKDFWKAVTKDSPDGLRYLLNFFFAYAIFNFIIFFFQVAPLGKQIGPPSPLVWRGFSGHWMVFYLAAYAILSSAARSSRLRPRGLA
jgi:hypothetical protein